MITRWSEGVGAWTDGIHLSWDALSGGERLRPLFVGLTLEPAPPL